MNLKKASRTFFTTLLIAIVAGSAAYYIQTTKFDFSTTLPQKRISKTPGYHRVPIIDFKDRTMVALGDFTTNMAMNGNSGKFMKTKVNVRTTGEEVSEELIERNVLVRDAVIRTLSQKRFDDIASMAGKQRLKDQISEEINAIVTKGSIEEVYFTEFIIQ